jgi:Lanthionine synthetase C-like protein
VLYDARAHEPLVDDPWDAERALAGIRAIVADAVAAADPQTLWPAAEWDAWMAEAPLANLYVGAAGVVWALDELHRTGHAEVDLDLGVLARRALARFRERPDYSGWPVPVPDHAAASLWLGESGILLVAWKLDPSPDLADSLLARVRENVDNDADDVMWGTAGTMLAAHALYEWTGDERWADARRANAAAVLGRRGDDGLWTQHLYGESFQGLSASHGFAGIVQALAQTGERVADAGEVAARHAIVEVGLANWPDAAGRELRSHDGEIRVQWDTGAPGIVAALGGSRSRPASSRGVPGRCARGRCSATAPPGTASPS